MYPYGHKQPIKDPSKATFTLVDVNSKKEKKIFLDWLKKKGFVLISESMYDDEGIFTLGIPVNLELNKKVGYVSCLPVRAHLVYHGAKYYHKAYKFILDFLELN